MPNYIGLDLGTTTVTGVLLDVEQCEVMALAQRDNDAAVGGTPPTRAEQDPHRLWALALAVLAELATAGHPVDGIALTGQKHGLLCVDGHNRPLTPLISWQDRRTAEPLLGGRTMLDEIHARLVDLDWRPNGCRLAHGYGAASLYWLVREDALPSATQQTCTIASWLACQLAGQPAITDPTFAASWGVYDLVTGTWNDAFLSRLGLEVRLLPQVQPSGAPLAGLTPHVAKEVSLPAGLPIMNALGDTQASFVGAALSLCSLSPPQVPSLSPPLSEVPSSLPPRPGVPSSSPPRAGGTEGGLFADSIVLFNLGTGGQICWIVPQFELPTETVETRPLPVDRFLRVGASLCGGAAYAWLNDTVRAWLAEFGLELDRETVYKRLNTLVAACTDDRGLQVRTTFLGVRGDPTVQGGAIEGISPGNMALGILARATLTGIVDELHGLYHAQSGGRLGHSRVVAAGGGVRRNPLLPGLIEERFGLPVVVPPWRETAAVGAAALVEGC